jgi:hypothetical protein
MKCPKQRRDIGDPWNLAFHATARRGKPDLGAAADDRA